MCVVYMLAILNTDMSIQCAVHRVIILSNDTLVSNELNLFTPIIPFDRAVIVISQNQVN